MTKEQRQHVEEFGRIGALFNRAIATSSQREKDAGLTELKQTSVEQVQTLEKQLKTNEQKRAELAQLQKNYKELEKVFQTTVLNKKLLDKLYEKDLEINKEKEQKKIIELEKEISHYSHLERPNLMNEAIKKGKKVGIRLYDVRIQRTEEEIYALRKRILNVESNQTFSKQIKNEFGSTFGLIDTYDKLLEENKKLKEHEYEILNDPISKRRNISGISIEGARDLATFFQVQFGTELDVLGVLGIHDKPKNSQDFDLICQDLNFTEEIVTKQSNVKQPDDAEDLKKELDQLMEERSKLQEPVFDPTSQFRGRDGKLLELLTFLIKDLHKKNTDINEASSKSDEKIREIHKTAHSLREMKLKYFSIFEPYRSLVNSHVQLMAKLSRNRSVLKTLSSVGSQLSLKNLFFDDYMMKRIKSRTPEISQQSEEKKGPSLIASGRTKLRRIISVPKIENVGHLSARDRMKAATVALKSVSALPKIDSLVPNVLRRGNQLTEENFINFYLSSVLGELMCGLYNEKAERIAPMFNKVYEEVRGILEDHFVQFSNEMRENISAIQQCSHSILAYEKNNIDVQTENAVLVDIEIQNEEKPLYQLKKKPEKPSVEKKKL